MGSAPQIIAQQLNRSKILKIPSDGQDFNGFYNDKEMSII